ncbi:MAG: MotA/TolQ/ExbB proton channel family protein [Terrimicrobiaceae bacterium]|jgi:biopolymer transport protein ExbB
MKSISFAVLFLAAAPAVFAQEEAPGQTTNLWQVVASGGPVMYPLGAMSVLAVMLIVVYLFTMRRGSVVSGRYMQTADALIRKKDLLGLLAISNRHNEAIASVMERSLNFLTKNPGASIAEAREIAQAEGIRLAGLWNQRISYLADLGSIAPMVGLFGTVLGMIKSFTVVASDIVASRPMMLAEGVAEALITTAAGLFIGIPTMAAYAFFRGRVQGMISDLEAASTVLMAQLGVGHQGDSRRD